MQRHATLPKSSCVVVVCKPVFSVMLWAKPKIVGKTGIIFILALKKPAVSLYHRAPNNWKIGSVKNVNLSILTHFLKRPVNCPLPRTHANGANLSTMTIPYIEGDGHKNFRVLKIICFNTFDEDTQSVPSV